MVNWKGVCQILPHGSVIVHPGIWRVIGSISTLVGFITYAMIPPLNKLLEHAEWGFLVVAVYCAVGSIVFCMMLCTTEWNATKKASWTANAVFFVLMVSSVYSFYLDKTEEGTKKSEGEKVLNLVSCGALSMISLSLSRLTCLRFEAGVTNFFLGSLMVAVMEWNLLFSLGVAIFCYIVINIRTYALSSPMEEVRVPLIQNEERGSLVVPTLGLAPLALLPPPVMYDAFISYRAKDTSDIPEYLTCALLDKSLRVYAHEEITGHYVPPSVVKEIERAKVSVIIISESYLHATWCWDELCNTMACHARFERIVMPIFYHLNNLSFQDPSVNFYWIQNHCDANHVSTLDKHKWSFYLAEAAKMGRSISRDRGTYEILGSVADDVLSYCTIDQV